MESIVPQDYWDASYEHLPLTYHPDRVLFKDLFEKYLPKGGTCLEVGCYPGDYLIYLGRNFGYTVNGIDTSHYVSDRLPLKLANYGVKVGEFIQDDFRRFEFKRTYDLVCSFGFIEHFLNYEDILQKHIDLINNSGTLVLACPNFRNLQFILHYLLDNTNLMRHNINAMNLKEWKRIIENNDMHIIYQGYYQTFDFWVDNPSSHIVINKVTHNVIRLSNYLNSNLNCPNPYLSPYLITFAKKDC